MSERKRPKGLGVSLSLAVILLVGVLWEERESRRRYREYAEERRERRAEAARRGECW